MGATTPYMMLRERRSGQTQTLGLYYAGGDTAGYVVPTTPVGAAGASSPKDFTLPEGVWDITYITGPSTGKIRFYCNGQPGPIALDMASVIAMVSRPVTHGAMVGGTKFRYSIIVEATMAA